MSSLSIKIHRIKKWFFKKDTWKQVFIIGIIAFLLLSSAMFLWVATLRIPDLQSFQDRVLSGSTKIYDKTGEVILYDLNKDVRQQVVAYDQISEHIKHATIAIEDAEFYNSIL